MDTFRPQTYTRNRCICGAMRQAHTYGTRECPTPYRPETVESAPEPVVAAAPTPAPAPVVPEPDPVVPVAPAPTEPVPPGMWAWDGNSDTITQVEDHEQAEGVYDFSLNEIAVRVFLTREAAVAALGEKPGLDPRDIA